MLCGDGSMEGKPPSFVSFLSLLFKNRILRDAGERPLSIF